MKIDYFPDELAQRIKDTIKANPYMTAIHVEADVDMETAPHYEIEVKGYLLENMESGVAKRG